jgi:hypothetical protein
MAMVKVIVPDTDFRADDEARTFWSGTRGWFCVVRCQLGTEMAYSVILSAIGRQLRRDVGVEEAKQVFRDMADTMDEAAKADLDDD